MYDIKFYLLNPSGGTILKGKQMNKKLWLASGLACAILLAFIFTSSDRPAEAVEAYAAEISEAMSEPAGEARERRKAEIAEKFSPQFCELMADDSLDDSDRAYFAHQAMALSRLLKKPSDALFKVREYMSATFPIEDANGTSIGRNLPMPPAPRRIPQKARNLTGSQNWQTVCLPPCGAPESRRMLPRRNIIRYPISIF